MMNFHWKEVLPIDRYTVRSNGLIHDYDRKIIILLYQPLIGPLAVSLYMSLWAQLEENRLWSISYNHHELMSFLDMSLSTVYEQRLKLEGIGLLKTYVEDNGDIRSFIYELQPPLMPDQFFIDGMLNVYLYQKIGAKQYNRLKKFFSDEQIAVRGEYKEVTRSFQDVYQSKKPTMELPDEEERIEYIGKRVGKNIQVHWEEHFDFDLFLAGLSENLVPKEAITVKVKEAISNLAFLYGIDPLQMQKLVIAAMDETTNSIQIDELRKNARDWYKFENYDKLPQLIDHIQPLIYREQMNEPTTEEERLIFYFENTSPRQLLIDITGEAKPSLTDLKVIEGIMFDQKLFAGVVNVLIHFVLMKTDMKLSKNYIETIASHWARKGVKTVREAMELAKSEDQKYKEWAKKKQEQKVRKRAPIRTELLPDWFDKDESTVHKDNKIDEQQLEAMKKEIEENLKKLKK